MLKQLVKTDEKFREFFGVSFKRFWDAKLSVISGKISIDIMRFDEYLTKKYEDEYTDDMSMQEFITQKFGNAASKFVFKLVNLEIF